MAVRLLNILWAILMVKNSNVITSELNGWIMVLMNMRVLHGLIRGTENYSLGG